METEGSWTEVQSKSPAGVLGNKTSIKYHQAGLGEGCWITRVAFDAVGGLDEGIDVNKDTKLSVRLAASEHRCYCDHTPGFILIRDLERSAYDQSSITNATGARARYRAFEYILLQHQEFLKNHGAFRGKMFPRVIKYHVCAASLADWFWFCAHYWPVSDVVLYIVPGTLWLGLSKLIPRKP